MKTTAFLLLALMVLAACSPAQNAPLPTAMAIVAPTSSRRLLNESGRVDEVSKEFIVLSNCPGQLLSYKGFPVDRDLGPASVSFRVVNESGDEVESFGPADLAQSGDGVYVWTLDPGRYTVETTAINASWNYKLHCR